MLLWWRASDLCIFTLALRGEGERSSSLPLLFKIGFHMLSLCWWFLTSLIWAKFLPRPLCFATGLTLLEIPKLWRAPGSYWKASLLLLFFHKIVWVIFSWEGSLHLKQGVSFPHWSWALLDYIFMSRMSSLWLGSSWVFEKGLPHIIPTKWMIVPGACLLWVHPG